MSLLNTSAVARVLAITPPAPHRAPAYDAILPDGRIIEMKTFTKRNRP